MNGIPNEMVVPVVTQGRSGQGHSVLLGKALGSAVKPKDEAEIRSLFPGADAHPVCLFSLQGIRCVQFCQGILLRASQLHHP